MGDLYGFAMVAATIAGLTILAAPGYRNHSEFIEWFLEVSAWVIACLSFVVIAALLRADVEVMVSCAVTVIFYGALWLCCSLSYLLFFG